MRVSYRLEALALRWLMAFFAALPLPAALRLGAWIGGVLGVIALPYRRIALRNLRTAFPEKTTAERRRILRASCRNLGRLAAEFSHLPRLDRQALEKIVAIPDRAQWEQVVCGRGQTGAIALTAHIGNWELLAHAHGMLGHPVTLVHRPMNNPLVEQIIARVRAVAGTRALPKKAAAREAVKTLRAGGLLAIASDQNQTARYGVFVDFFGVLACTTPGVARLAALTGAPVFPVFLLREGESGRHRLLLLPRLEMVETGDQEADIAANTQRCSRVIEDVIRRYPEQWIWFHQRWRTRPAPSQSCESASLSSAIGPHPVERSRSEILRRNGHAKPNSQCRQR